MDKLDRKGITVKFEHVKAHQDKKANRKKDKQGNLIPLTQPVLLNIDCDARAEDQYAEPTTPQARDAAFNNQNILRIIEHNKHRQTSPANSMR